MKAPLQRENNARRLGDTWGKWWVLSAMLGLLVAGCTPAESPFKFSRLDSPERYTDLHQDRVGKFIASQPPSLDAQIQRKWEIDKDRYASWQNEEDRRIAARQQRVTEIVERQERFFNDYLRMNRLREGQK